MTVAATNLITAASDTDATSYTTASITPVSGRLVLAWVSNEVTAGTPDIPALAGNGLNYVQVATVAVGQTRQTLFRALGLGSAPGTVLIDFGGATQIGASWSFVSFSGVNPGGTDGSAAVVQAVTNSGTGTSLTVTLAAFAAVGNATAAGFRHALAENATAGTGFAIVGQANGAAPARNHATEFRATNDTSVDATWTTSAANLGIAVELSAGTTSARTAPTSVIDAPARDPWPTGLIPTARVLGRLVTHTDDRFMGGLGFSPLACDPLEVFALCATVSLGATPTRDAERVFDPFTIVGADICSPIAWRTNDGQGRAMEQMLTLGSKPIEAEMWTGALTGNPHLGAASTTVVVAGAQTPVAGLAALEQAIADGNSGSGAIYARPSLVEVWDGAGLLRRDPDGTLATINGTPVIAGSGFPGTGPNGEAVSTTSEWAYATDAFEVHIGPASSQTDDIAQATNRSTNTTAWRVEMGAVAIWGGCLTVTVQINPSVSDEGGLTNAQLRADPVPVSGPLTDAQLRAVPVPVSGTVVATSTAVHAEDAVAANAADGVFVHSVRRDADGANTSADGDYAEVQTDSQGRVKVTLPGSTPTADTAAADTAVVRTFAAVVGQRHRVTLLSGSVSALPTACTLQVTDGATLVFDADIVVAGPFSISLPAGGIQGSVNSAVTVTLSAAGAAVVGKLNTAKVTA